jgi:acetylserotonin N-methyltransferase
MFEPSPADPSVVLDLINAFRRSAVLFAGVSLGVFDRLAAGPADLATLAADLHANADALLRLLDTCVGLGLLQRQGERFANTSSAAAYLCKNSPRRMTGYITYSDRILWKLWAHLSDAVREGTNRWKQGLGLEGPLFTKFFQNEDDKREFLLGMHGFGQISSPEVVAAFDLSGYRHLVDLGGATGHLAVAACRRFPNLRATVFDLTAVVPMAQEMIAVETDVASRIDVAAGDFFTDPLPRADLFAVGRILHDWGEDKIHRLLGVINQALPRGGALLIAEKLLDDDRAGPPWALLQSLNMLVCAEGKERTAGEYTALLRRAGFTKIEARHTASPLDAILAVKE